MYNTKKLNVCEEDFIIKIEEQKGKYKTTKKTKKVLRMLNKKS